MWDNDDIPEDFNHMYQDYLLSLDDCPVLNSYEKECLNASTLWIESGPTWNYRHIMKDIFCNGLTKYYFDI